ncbi:MAG: N-acetyltransferase [Patescibacteria group bacterium]
MDKIKLRPATIADLKVILALEKGADSKMYSARLKESEVRYSLQREHVFLVKLRSLTIGLAVYRVAKNQTVTINGLIIAPKYQGRGFARQAMILMLRKIRSYSRIEMMVHPHNVRALSLYLSLGFMIDSWHKNHFGDGEPRLLLIKKWT